MDFELLLTEIEQRPAIWDPRDLKHCNRDLLKKYWYEIAHILQLEGILVEFSENFHEKIKEWYAYIKIFCCDIVL